jgi:hypothetical protein
MLRTIVPAKKAGGGLLLALALAALFACGAAASTGAQRSFSLAGNPLVRDGAGPEAPEVETEPPNEIGRTDAVLRATVNPEGSQVSKCEFEYGTTPSLGTKANCEYSPGSGNLGVPVYAIVEGLNERTTYYFRIFAENGVGEGHGELQQFMTLPDRPHVVTEPATKVTKTEATLNGVVNPQGEKVTECFFEYGTTEEYGRSVACEQSPGVSEKSVHVTAKLSGLEKSTTYDFRLVAVNSEGSKFGDPESFTTEPSAPLARTEEASSVKHKSATLEGAVNPDGAAITECVFFYGKTKKAEGSVPCASNPPAGEKFVAVSASLSGLEEKTEYFFDLVVKNEAGEDFGGYSTFNTLPAAPRDNTANANELTGDSALLHGTVNPEGETPTVCEFEYGTTEKRFEKSVPCTTSPGNGEAPVNVEAPVSGLEADTTYYFRLHAEDQYGFAYGGQSKFTTKNAGELPEVSSVKPGKGPATGGTTVKIKGANFAGVTEVHFGATAATGVKFISVKEISAVAPAGTSGRVYITVTTPNGTSAIGSGSEFRYEPPTITSVSPSSGSKAGGVGVTVGGSGFSTESGKTVFEFASAKATSVVCASTTSCTMLTPAGSDGEVKVTVSVNGESSSTKKGHGYTYD